MKNLQVIEKQSLHGHGFLDVQNVFRTIQGEGPFAGTPAMFVRLAGCNLQCPLCDTDYTTRRALTDPRELFDTVETNSQNVTNLVVITGGEPLRQNISPFVHLLLDQGFQVQVETNGTLWVPGLPVEEEHFHIVCSPKTPKLNVELLPHIDAFKYVLHADSVDPTDGLPIHALELGTALSGRVARPPEEIFGELEYIGGMIYLQPADSGKADLSQNARNLQATIDSCLKYNYTFCLQIQKIIGME